MWTEAQTVEKEYEGNAIVGDVGKRHGGSFGAYMRKEISEKNHAHQCKNESIKPETFDECIGG